MANPITTACGRADLYAFYGDHDQVSLPVIGWDERGRALVQKADGSTVLARRARLGGLRFRCVEVGEAER